MTRAEEITMAADAASRYESPSFFEAFVTGAEWADNSMLEKACEWLYEYNRKQTDKMFGTGLHTADVTINVAQFRKAMEGGEK